VLEIRPLPKEALGGTGIRNVPSLSTATGGIPFLRFKGEEISPFLTRVIGDKIEQRFKRRMRIEEYETLKEMGEAESLWDFLVEAQGWREGVEVDGAIDSDVDGYEERGVGGEEKCWGWIFGQAIGKVYKDSGRDFEKTERMADRMVKIVDQEREMAIVEKVERLKVRDQERRERKKVREEEEKMDEQRRKNDTKNEWGKLVKSIDGLENTNIIVK